MMTDYYIYMLECFLLYALGLASGCSIFLLIIYIAEKTGHKRDFYYNSEDEYYENDFTDQED